MNNAIAIEDQIQFAQLKLSLLDTRPEDLKMAMNRSRVSSYIGSTRTLIGKASLRASRLKKRQDGYNPLFADIAQEILSNSPFTTTAHLCKVFNCISSQLDEWKEIYPAFGESIQIGLSTGEVLARDLLFETSLEPSSAVNTGLLKILSSNVYNIKDERTVAVTGKNGAPLIPRTIPTGLDLSKLTDAELVIAEKMGLELNATTTESQSH